MDIEEYIKYKGRSNSIYKSALRLAYDYHKDMSRERLLVLQDKAKSGDTSSWEGLATCMIIYELLKTEDLPMELVSRR